MTMSIATLVHDYLATTFNISRLLRNPEALQNFQLSLEMFVFCTCLVMSVKV